MTPWVTLNFTMSEKDSHKGICCYNFFFLIVKLFIPPFQLECLVAMDISFGRNTRGKTPKIRAHLNRIWGVLVISSALSDLVFIGKVAPPIPQLQKQLTCVKWQVAYLPNNIPDAKNRALKIKRKSDSKPSYAPGFFLKRHIYCWSLSIWFRICE